MARNYTFNYLNIEGKIMKVVGIMCADDEAASMRAPYFRPARCVTTEIWSGDRRVSKPENESNHPGH
jgi:hypothetical protein